jgi:DNA-directed RNA polymerase specialized sigma24 family protein
MCQTEVLTNEQLIEQFRDLIWGMANRAYYRIKKPAAYTMEDLAQEGFADVIICYHRWWKPDRGASLKTFVTRCLISLYANIVKESYRDLDDHNFGKAEKSQLFQEHMAEEIDLLDKLHECFSELECRYIEAITQIEGHQGSGRKRIRNELGITFEDEIRLRESIRMKITA